MSIQLVGLDTLGTAKAGQRPPAVRMIAAASAVVVRVALKIAEEVAYTIREDCRHGQISRDPKDWER